ncbi:YbaB/EbfC family nucleoid-associated protein [Phytomonospora sp. NPDC050363]|uniref:YbaB/EbfC family nucleoid-associated protein n=1 Tax=Phytomonospora sp. NPDC050363 TaxID=3155642 RepID=UPI0033CDE7A3
MADFGQDIQHRAREIQRIVAEARTEVFSEDYAVKVVVGPGGAVIDVELTSRASKYSGAELGELILEQIKRAAMQMNAELSEQLSGLMGENAGTTPAALNGLPSAGEIQRVREENKRETTEEF